MPTNGPKNPVGSKIPASAIDWIAALGPSRFRYCCMS